MKRSLLVAAACISLAAAAGGCYPNRLDSVDYDAVATVFDSTANFHVPTYAMDDTVIHLVPIGVQDPISHAPDAAILAKIRADMTAAGYTEVASPTTADLTIRVAVSSTEYTAVYWDYWCGYWGYWYPYGCGYPQYYTYSYTVGSLFIAMGDQRSTGGNNRSLIWLAIGNGIVAGTIPDVPRITGAIDQMFEQSPYVQATP